MILDQLDFSWVLTSVRAAASRVRSVLGSSYGLRGVLTSAHTTDEHA